MQLAFHTFWNGSDRSIAILFDTSFDTPNEVSLLQFNCNLNATAVESGIAAGVLPAAQRRHQNEVAEVRTTTISEILVFATVRCTVRVNTAVHWHRDAR